MTADISSVVAVTSGRTRLAPTVSANSSVATAARAQATVGSSDRAAAIPATVETNPLTATGDHHGSANAAGTASAASPTRITLTASAAGGASTTTAATASRSSATGICGPGPPWTWAFHVAGLKCQIFWSARGGAIPPISAASPAT